MSKLIKNRPGGPLEGRPVSGIDGKWYDQFGREIKFDPKDIKYSDLFWSRNQPRGIKEAMIDNIVSASEGGLFGCFVAANGITDYDKERLSAYRVLAKQMGYEIGEYKFNARSGNATVPIWRQRC
ncbi:MAG: hypothetical protein AABX29_07085 [Nanoarchaeota archaeon]